MPRLLEYSPRQHQPRGRTLRRGALRGDVELEEAEYRALQLLRPRTRGECVDGPRPCPWVSCRHHLGLDVTAAGSLQLVRVDVEPWELEQTCSLDLADEGEQTLGAVGKQLNVTRERIRQLELKAMRKFLRAPGGRALVRALFHRLPPGPGASREPRPGEQVWGYTVLGEDGRVASGARRVRVRCACGAERLHAWRALLAGQVPRRCSACSAKGGRRAQELG